jgi:hypothetical protein
MVFLFLPFTTSSICTVCIKRPNLFLLVRFCVFCWGCWSPCYELLYPGIIGIQQNWNKAFKNTWKWTHSQLIGS